MLGMVSRTRCSLYTHLPYGVEWVYVERPRLLQFGGDLLVRVLPGSTEGAACEARCGCQAASQTEVRGTIDSQGLPLNQPPPQHRRPAHGSAKSQGRDA